ncbi:hypothetical protein P9139_13280 [Curtobacterium flaccumfaciens]|nr:hypothetical protein P9139_13280 [Curtobacterium flaccumfaciens]
MAEPVDAWWRRRQWSRGAPVPYAVGEFRAEWASYPVLVRQYHPERNHGVVLSQVPPAAEVLLTWECDVGHVFVATPAEQRSRPGRERRRSVWCPECAVQAQPQRWPVLPPDWPSAVPVPQRVVRVTGRQTLPAAPARGPGGRRRLDALPVAPSGPRRAPAATASGGAASDLSEDPAAALGGVVHERVCPGDGVRGRSRAPSGPRRTVRLHVRPHRDPPRPAVLRPRRGLAGHHPAELRVAIEYDSTGRHGLEHVGPRQETDRRKDRAVRGVGWQVVRIRTGRLQALGPYDLEVPGISGRTTTRLVDTLREIRGALFVDAYAR